MKKTIISAAAATLALLSFSTAANAQQDRTRIKDLQSHIYYFASDSLQGRKAGTESSAKAARYIANEFQKAGVLPLFDDGYEMPFSRDGYSEYNFFDVVGYIPGSDPVLKSEIIVIGAHFDHLGVRYDGEVFNGADDNASGSAALIEVAKLLTKDPSKIKRTVILCGFDGEEMGLFGSYAIANQLKTDDVLQNVKLMISVDMVGWLKAGGALMMEGTGTIKNGDRILKSHADAIGLPIKMKKFETSLFTATDTQGFAEMGLATLDMTTGTKSPYHKVGDDPELIDYEGLDKITQYIADVVTDFASSESYAPSGKVAPKHRENIQRFEIAAKAGIGSAGLSFDDAKIYTSGGFSYQAGLGAKINMKHFAIEVDGIFEQATTNIPSEEDFFGAHGKFTQKSVVVPAYLLFQAQDHTTRFYIGGGPYWKKPLDTQFKNVSRTFDVDQETIGLAFTFGFGVGPLAIGAEVRSHAKVFSAESFASELTTSCFTVSYWF